ncbi:MAG: acyltransferase [Candidatus Aminicenantales bacterium]
MRVLRKKVFKLLARYSPGYDLRCLFLKMAGYKVGRDVFIGEDLMIVDELKDRCEVIIEDRVSIAPRVTLVVSSRPNFSRIRGLVSEEKGPIVIKKDAWIGTGVIILPNVCIGEGAVVGAGSVVTRDVAPHSVVVGMPAYLEREIKSG